jgi:osmotically-inducible protein OsmY
MRGENMNRFDENIKKDLIDRLFWDFRVDASKVKAEVSYGKVTLTGSVPSYMARNAAFDVACGIPGVKEVINLLRVAYSPISSVLTDVEIEGRIKDTLAWNPDIYSVGIDVLVRGGKVRLYGSVNSYWKRCDIENIIASQQGVISVENHLSVVPSNSRSDKEIAKNISAALERNVYVDAEKITVKVVKGNVTLTGTVPSHYALYKAYDAAAFTPGVIQVDNFISVS